MTGKARIKEMITANHILQKLQERHLDDVFVAECRTGSSQVLGSPILDAWVMKKSWCHPLTIGYEIKIDRVDFEYDEKWRKYLNFCNEFYFVCPANLIQPTELPDDTGLLWLSTTGTRLYRKKKAPYRVIETLEKLYKYILMSRIVVTDWQLKVSDRPFWENWLQEKTLNREVGQRVSKTLQKVIGKKIGEVETRNLHLEARIEAFEKLEILLRKLDIDDYSSWAFYSAKRQIEALQKLIPPEIKREIENTHKSLGNLLKEFEKLEAKGEEHGCQKDET